MRRTAWSPSPVCAPHHAPASSSAPLAGQNPATATLDRTATRQRFPRRFRSWKSSSSLLKPARDPPAATITWLPRSCASRPPRSNRHSAAASYPTSRAFLHWRLSDDGRRASGGVAMGRHPKPFTKAEAASIFEPHLLVRGTRVATGDDGVRVGLCENKLTPPSSGQRR